MARRGRWQPGESGNVATQFLPGVSGNPKGRPPKPLLEAAQDLTQLGLEVLEDILRHEPDNRIRMDAVSEVFNRGWGRPAQAVSIDAHVTGIVGGIDAPPLPETLEEWLQRRRAELAKLN